MIGETIAHYKITDKIGAGGMGEVFRARDDKLNRDVALKILPHAYAADAERLGRFQREARLLASLNHTNIAAIYGLEASDDKHALVLELVEGEDVAEILSARSIPIEESLEIAVQIAEALEYAHESGVVHRDLKPANVKVTPDGKVKVLDFGLAKALMEETLDSAVSNETRSPTLSIAASIAGVILGTAAYMSPEQARGKPADRRADIWAFGVVLFEMLSGKQLFTGETISDTLASVIKDEPDWGRLPSDTPVLVTELLRRCLEKSPRRRLQSVGEARIALEEALRAPGEGPSRTTLLSSSIAGAPVDSAMQAKPQPARGRLALAWISSLVLVAIAAGFLGTRLGSPTSPPTTRRFYMQPEDLLVAYPTPPALSPDGTRVAYFAGASLFVRDLDALEPIAISESDAATSPFWSPDGAWLAFGRGGRVYKVPAEGGTPTRVCNFPFGTLDGGFWGDDGMLYLSPNVGPIHRVSERGGDPEPLFANAPGESDFHTPSVLPGGRGVVFTTHNSEGRQTVELFAGGERKVLFEIPNARLEYTTWTALPGSETRGHLVYHRQGPNPGIWAVPFDLETLELTGDAFLLDANGTFPSVSRDGSLLYSIGSGGGPQQLALVTRKGEIVSRVGQPQLDLAWPAVSPTDDAVLVSALEGDNRDIWLHDVERGTRTRITFSPDGDQHAVWANNGRDIAFARNPGGAAATAVTYIRPVDGSLDPRLLFEGYFASIPDGLGIAVFTKFSTTGTSEDILYQRLDSEEEPQEFLATGANETGGALSPDGKFVVYMSNESGANEIYVRTFPSATGKWQVSTTGGTWPRWSRAGDEIFFRSGGGAAARMMSVSFTSSPSVQLGQPEVMFTSADAPQLSYVPGGARFDVTSDPDLFCFIEYIEPGRGDVAKLVYVENWYESFRNEGP